MTQNNFTTLILNTHSPAHTYSCQALVTYISSNCRPPKGMAGYVDWVMDGHISNLVLQGKVKGSFRESLLLVTSPKIKASLSLIFGAGDPRKLDIKKIGSLGDYTGSVLNDLNISRLGLDHHDLLLPGLDIFRALNSLMEGLKGHMSNPTKICLLANTQELKDIVARWLQEKKS